MYFDLTGVWLTVPLAESMTLLLVIYLIKVNPVEKHQVLMQM
jgi:hypothetical protein